MKLIIISPPDDYPDEHQVVRRLLNQSSATFHLRKPGWGHAQLADYLRHIPSGLHPRIMVHDHSRLLRSFTLKGVHFTEKRRRQSPQAIEALKQQTQGCRISSAFHRIADIPEPDGLLDDVFLSPIFDSISKKGYRAAFTHAELRDFLARTGHSVVALGGIDARRIAQAAALGFKGVAALGAVWMRTVPENAARALSIICSGIQAA
jgi:thiamine-phosphate pyrophosphorylase